ncbi:MAG: hypothetical protein ACRDN0_04525 [Trebonia sp.]
MSSWPSRLPFKVASWANLQAGPDVIEAFRAHAVDVAENAGIPPIQAENSGLQVKIVAVNLTRKPIYKFATANWDSAIAWEQETADLLAADLCDRHRPAVLLVTHDVDEAALLADRVVVLADGRVGLDLTVDLPQPRSPRHAGFFAYRERLLGALGVTELNWEK